MAYLDEIKEAYGWVRKGETSQSSVQKALQYENWQRLPDEITKKALDHRDYHHLDAEFGERPVRNCPMLVQDCQISRNKKKIDIAYSLYRSSGSHSQFGMIDADDFPQLWRKLEKDRKPRKPLWISIDSSVLTSETDLHAFVCRLGLYHWLRIPPPIYVFCLELHYIECVKPNALDAGLAFYFHQTSGQEPGRTRSLETGEPDMEEWLCLEVDNDSINCVGGCLVRQKVEVNMDSYYITNAARIGA